MRLCELFLKETSEEDRALISLSAEIYKKMYTYRNSGKVDSIKLGKISDIVDTPINALHHVNIDLARGTKFAERAKDENNKDEDLSNMTILGVWEYSTNTIVFNLDYLDKPRMKTTVTHELRHALDEVKSKSFPVSRNYKKPKEKINPVTGIKEPGTEFVKYFTPKNKAYRKFKSASYAQPAEINARFVEVLDYLTRYIPKRYADTDSASIKGQLTKDLNKLFNRFSIAQFFPEKTASADYKRLIKRAYDFMDKEMAYVEAGLKKAGKPKIATGSW